ncbi:SNF2 family N-terminal domain-containing protein, partial [Ochromonadaceae sp. CCMP2298]
ALRLLVHHGADRTRAVDELLKFDVVVTSYDVLASEHGKGGGPLLQVQWHRVVLDESHIIRNTKTAKYKACVALSATYRWCLSGTPLVNSGTHPLHPLEF